MTPRHDPVDVHTRDEIREAHTTTLLVEAGAGTGKTTALVSRVIAMVATGRTDLAHLGAITFTEAAAAELRDRIRVALEGAASGRDPTVIGADARHRCSEALGELDDAALTTLHGFAQRILAAHPLEAGLPPRFEVLDDVEANIEFQQRWDELADELVEEPALEQVLLRAFALGVTLDGLRAVARALCDHVDRLEPAPVTSAVDLDGAVPNARRFLRSLDAALSARFECGNDTDKLAAHLDALAAWRRELGRAADDVDRLDALREAPPIASKLGKAANWPDVGRVRELLSEAAAAHHELLDGARADVLHVLLARVIQFARDGLERRRREGRLEFHDLLVLARRVLRDRHGVRVELARRFQVILIDEFQDTDPIQIQLAALLTAPLDTDDVEWDALSPRPGSLFLVGDPKQSIYGFRRADLALYDRARAMLRPGRRELVESFRSVPGVLEWVNHVFDRLLAEGEEGVQAPAVPLRPHRPPLTGAQHPVAIVGGPVDDRIGAIREAAATDLAGLIREIKHDGWLVDDGHGGARAARYDDVALLLPTRAALPTIEDAFERAEIPARIESQSLVFATGEVRDLLSVLTALDDPTDELAIVAALRAPAFGCGDDDLVAYASAGGRWTYLGPVPTGIAPEHPVPAALAALRELHESRWTRSVAEILDEVIRTRRLLELASVHPRPRDHWRRIRFLLDQARAYGEAGGSGLRGFVEWARRQAEEGAKAVEIVVPEPDDDAVRILTVHGAKGLEFPIVVLAGLEAQPNARSEPVRWGARGEPAIRVGVQSRGTLFTSEGYDELNRTARMREDAERLRVLYVAATRARDHLVVALHHKAGTRCAAASLWPLLADAPCVTLEVPRAPTCVPALPRPGRPGSGGPAVLAERAEWAAARETLLAYAARPATLAATALAELRPGRGGTADPALAEESPPDDAPPWRRGRAGTAIGRAVHATLQSVDLRTGAGLLETARAQALAEGVPDREAEIAALARSVLGAPIVREAARSGRFWRELPVGAPIGDVVLEGFVDLLVATDDGLVVVDYKTDVAPTSIDLEAAVDRYATQGAAYALALEEVLHRKVARVQLVFARTAPPAIERSIHDLAGSMRAVRDLATRVAQPRDAVV